MSVWNFATAARIVFGCGSFNTLGELASSHGSSPVLLLGSAKRFEIEACEQIKPTCVLTQSGEPTISHLESLTECARKAGSDSVIAIGGGAVIDAGKALAAMLTNLGEPLDYLEVVGKGLSLQNLPAPFIAVPTTAGTGAEVTRNAVIGVPERGVKVSMRDAQMLPDIALVDPTLTYGLPQAITAASGMDALTQLIEPYTSCKANVFTDMLCREGIPLAADALEQAWRADTPAAREAMARASLYGGLSLANAGLGAVHGIAGPLGGMFDAPHGAVCARLLPFVMEANLEALRNREPTHESLTRYQEIAGVLTRSESAKPEDGIAVIHQLCETMSIPPLSTYGITEADLPELCTKAQKASSMKGNPLSLSEEELSHVLQRAL